MYRVLLQGAQSHRWQRAIGHVHPRDQRLFHARPQHQQQQASPHSTPLQQSPNQHRNFYKSHGRALFKALTLAFFSYQCFYWAWVTLEAEQLKDEKNQEIKSLTGEVRLLEEGRNSHRPGAVVSDDRLSEAGLGKRLLEEKDKKG